jgi:hypothetical protein
MTDRENKEAADHVMEQQAPDPKWVKEMHDHFQRRGFYRAEDLGRVLGDPRDHVQVKTETVDPANLMGLVQRCG